MRPSLATKMHSLRETSLCVLLGVIIMGLLASSLETEAGSVCAACSKPSANDGPSESFTVKNALPQGDADLHTVCNYYDDCGGLTTQIVDYPCDSVEFHANLGRAPSEPGIHQILCEFTWTRLNSEQFYRAQIMVWSRDGDAPKKTYYKADILGFWYSESPYGKLTKLGTWESWNYLSAEEPLKGAGNTRFQGFNRLHCRKSS